MVSRMDIFLLVINHEEKIFYYSEGEFADQYYDELKKVEKYEFYSKKFLIEFLKEQRNEYFGYMEVEVTPY